MNVRHFGASHQGWVREENQDAWGIFDLNNIDRGLVVVVADGMGGHSGGKTASNLAIETFVRTYASAAGRYAIDWIERAFAWANQAVLDHANASADYSSMGTTLSALVFTGKEIWMGTAGDSRVHMIRNGRIRQISEDDTVAARLLNEGGITLEEAAMHPQKHVLTKVIGSHSFPGVSPASIRVIPDDVFLVSTDGFYNLVHEEEILSALHCFPEEDALNGLIELALQRGGDDNITAVCIRFSANNDTRSSTQSSSQPTDCNEGIPCER